MSTEDQSQQKLQEENERLTKTVENVCRYCESWIDKSRYQLSAPEAFGLTPEQQDYLRIKVHTLGNVLAIAKYSEDEIRKALEAVHPFCGATCAGKV